MADDRDMAHDPVDGFERRHKGREIKGPPDKVDLSQATGVAPAEFEKQLRELKPSLKTVRTNCATGEGIAEVAKALGL